MKVIFELIIAAIVCYLFFSDIASEFGFFGAVIASIVAFVLLKK